MRVTGFVVSVLSVVLWASPVLGAMTEAVAFDNFGPNNTYSNGGWWMGSGFGEVMYVAGAFTPTVTGQLTRLDAGMTGNSPNQVTLYLLPQVGQSPPTAGALWHETYNNALSSNYLGLATFAVENGPTINAGTQYWLYVETPVTDNYGWGSSLYGIASTAAYFAQSPFRAQTWDVYDPLIYDPPIGKGRSLRAMVAVPEPAGCLPLVAVALIGRRRRNARLIGMCPR